MIENLEDLVEIYDVIICGAGSSGSAVAGRLAENVDIRVLLLEAGGSDDTDAVLDTDRWPMALGSDLDWAFQTVPDSNLSGRALLYSMGKVLGGGSSINVGTWSKGHQADWDGYAAEAGDSSWDYEHVSKIYRDRVENHAGVRDPRFDGVNGAMHVEQVPPLNPFAAAVMDAAEDEGLRRFPGPGGDLMVSAGGCAPVDNIIRNGKRQSAYRSYVHPRRHQPSLTVLTHAEVSRITFDGKRATGIEYHHNNRLHRTLARLEVVICQGAIQTPKLLMQSGIGDPLELGRHNIPIVQHLAGVGRNLHDHVALSLVWEATDVALPAALRSSMVAFWKTKAEIEAPNCYLYAIGVPHLTPENAATFSSPETGWTILMGMRPRSRGRITLTGSAVADPPRIEANYLSDPRDMEQLKLGIERARAIGNSRALAPFRKGEFAPGNASAEALDRYIRNGLTTFWHQCGTAKMGRDASSVVDSKLKVHGIEGLRVADASILPYVTMGNTMAPCIVIGEQAAAFIRYDHKI